jgi:hypothetical protein
LFQNLVGFEQVPGKTGQKPGFSVKSGESAPKTEFLEQPRFCKALIMERGKIFFVSGNFLLTGAKKYDIRNS